MGLADRFIQGSESYIQYEITTHKQADDWERKLEELSISRGR
jgi:hypothetical protein